MIIGICGHKGSGKDYLSAILREYTGFKIVHFADPLKEMIAFLLNISIDELNDLKNHEDQKICNTNMRSILQKFGTDIMQKQCGKDIWIKQVLTEDNIIIPDVRFNHEADAISKRGGMLIKLLGGKTDSHISEIELDEIDNSKFDFVYDNTHKDAGILDFARKVSKHV